MSGKADELKAAIMKEYNLDDGQIETMVTSKPGSQSIKYWIRLNSPDGFPRWLIIFDEFYQIKCSQVYILIDEIRELVELLNIAADIMQRLEKGELG